jgi:hypothetical protein
MILIRFVCSALANDLLAQHFLESNASASLASFAAATDAVDEKSITVHRPPRMFHPCAANPSVMRQAAAAAQVRDASKP